MRFLFIDAVWTGSDRDRLPRTRRIDPIVGACWPFVHERFSYFIYGSYPIPERWRVDIFFAMLAVGVVWMLWLNAPRRDLGAFYFFIVVPVVSFILLTGWPLIGLRHVDTVAMGRRAGDHRGRDRRHRCLAADRHSVWRSAAARTCRRCGRCRSSSSSSCAACR